MTLNELLEALGLIWPRLLGYPSGLSALLLAWLGGWLTRLVLCGQGRPWWYGLHIPRPRQLPTGLELLALSAPLLVLALLPFPAAARYRWSIDLILAWVLLELPLSAAVLAGSIRREFLSAALNTYPVILLAALILALAVRSLDLAVLAAALPASNQTAIQLEPGASILALPLRVIGACALLAALPALLGLGPFRATAEQPIRSPYFGLALRLRAVAWIGLALTPQLAWAQPVTVFIIILLSTLAGLLLFDRLLAGQMARSWARGYAGLTMLLLLVFLIGTVDAALQRVVFD